MANKNLKELTLNMLINSKADVTLVGNYPKGETIEIVSRGKLTTRNDANGIALYDMNIIEFVFRLSEIKEIIITNEKANIYLW